MNAGANPGVEPRSASGKEGLGQESSRRLGSWGGAALAIVLGLAGPPELNADDSPASEPDLSGVWRLTVEDLSIWAPPYTLAKATGGIHWWLSVAGGELALLECKAQPERSCVEGNRPAGDRFEAVAVREIIVRDDLVAFQVAGATGAYEAYRLEDFAERRISGTYIVYDRYGGGPGSGPEYRARLILDKVD